MRQPQNAKRGRGRGRRGNSGGQPHVPNRNTSYESNGPDVKLRGNAQQLHEKYLALAHDAASAGERISAEAYSQFADHYFRLHQAAVGAAEARRQQDQPSESRQNGQGGKSASSDAPAGEAKSGDAKSGDAKSGDDKSGEAKSGDDKSDEAKAVADSDNETSAEVLSLSPAQLAEAVQEEQDTQKVSGS